MAKAKSKMIKIEDALVPVEEQPYKVPENWCWVKHNSILDISGGSQPAKSFFVSEPAEGYTQLYQTRDYGDNPIPVYIPDKYATKTTVEGDILLARYGGSLGKVFRAHAGAYNVALAKVIKIYPELLDDEFLYKYYFTQFYQDFCVRASNGRSAQAGFNRDDMNSIPFPLPPLTEQQRIVEQIESLFSKLDEAKEKTESVVEAYETNCASILKMAFRGELSKEWRNTNNLDMDSWRIRSFDECILKMQNGLAKRSGEEGELFGVLRLANLGEDDISTDDLREIRLTEKEQNAYKLNFNDVVMIRVNGSRENVGRQLLIRGDNNWAFCDHIIRIRFVEDIIPEYMIMFSKTDEYRNYIETHMVSSAGQNTISRKGLSELSISVPSYEEQKVIIDTVNSMMEKEKAAKAIMESVLSEIDMMKKSVLAKAFRGELGTNDPLEESSEILLKQIMEV